MQERIDNAVKEVLAGNINSFDQIAKNYYSEIFNVVQSIHPDKASYQDVVQEIFLIIYHKLGSYENNTHFSHWIKTIARNTCQNYRRNWFRKRIKEKSYHEDVFESAKTPERIPFKNICDDINKYLKKLDPKYKDTLNLFYYEDKSIKEISEHYKVSEEQVRVRLFRGRKILEREIKNARRT